MDAGVHFMHDCSACTQEFLLRQARLQGTERPTHSILQDRGIWGEGALEADVTDYQLGSPALGLLRSVFTDPGLTNGGVFSSGSI